MRSLYHADGVIIYTALHYTRHGFPKLVFWVDPFIENEIHQAPLLSYSLTYYILQAGK